MFKPDFDFDSYIEHLLATYKGDLVHLADAIGALRLGEAYGYRVLQIIYSPLTYRKHQNVLGLKFRDVLFEKSHQSHRSAGYLLVEKMNLNFRDVVNRHVYIDKEKRAVSV